MSSTDADQKDPTPDVDRNDLIEGLLYVHGRLNMNARMSLQAHAWLMGLVEVLDEKGSIDKQTIEAKAKPIADTLSQHFMKEGNGVYLQEPNTDKYSYENLPEIDCESRVHLCKASCCRLQFAMSKQDVEEGIVRWELKQPYLIAVNEQGYCTHLKEGTCHCTIYENRPGPCRIFDCRNDKRIWLDFDKREINPRLNEPNWPENATADL